VSALSQYLVLELICIFKVTLTLLYGAHLYNTCAFMKKRGNTSPSKPVRVYTWKRETSKNTTNINPSDQEEDIPESEETIQPPENGRAYKWLREKSKDKFANRVLGVLFVIFTLSAAARIALAVTPEERASASKEICNYVTTLLTLAIGFVLKYYFKSM